MSTCLVRFFFFALPLIFILGAASISNILIAAIKLSGFPSNEIRLFCFLFLALVLSCSIFIIHVSVDVKISSKNRLGSHSCQFIFHKDVYN